MLSNYLYTFSLNPGFGTTLVSYHYACRREGETLVFSQTLKQGYWSKGTKIGVRTSRPNSGPGHTAAGHTRPQFAYLYDD